MEILFIGTGAADWKKDPPVDAVGVRRLTSTLVDDCLLIDCGPASFDYLKYLGKDPSKITDILLTHSHGDHFSFEELEKFAKAAGKLRFWCDKAVHEKFEGKEIDGVELCTAVPYEAFETNGYKVLPMFANHYEVPTNENPLHYTIEKDGKKMFYGCDGSMFTGRTWACLRDNKLDCAILDCTSGDFNDHLRFGTHNSIPMVRMIVSSMRERNILGENSKAVASHLARTLHKSHEETTELLLKDNIITAYDGMTLTI
jgi:phosphoribosyl 1,2-cyclic phosphodiesterase